MNGQPVSIVECCDCMDFMAKYPDKFFELAIVDPPYRDENQPTKNMRNNGSMKSLEGRPAIAYWKELRRVSKEQIIWGANNFELPQWKGFVVWEKGFLKILQCRWLKLLHCLRGLVQFQRYLSYGLAVRKLEYTQHRSRWHCTGG